MYGSAHLNTQHIRQPDISCDRATAFRCIAAVECGSSKPCCSSEPPGWHEIRLRWKTQRRSTTTWVYETYKIQTSRWRSPTFRGSCAATWNRNTYDNGGFTWTTTPGTQLACSTWNDRLVMQSTVRFDSLHSYPTTAPNYQRSAQEEWVPFLL